MFIIKVKYKKSLLLRDNSITIYSHPLTRHSLRLSHLHLTIHHTGIITILVNLQDTMASWRSLIR